ncbi:MAG TPA: BTAD domain-containing putative transcriptional regulator [Anaerolineales bacterium]|nr:BTAD domain-containing putative transcriptional regulator [Anaerolineales bacterium]
MKAISSPQNRSSLLSYAVSRLNPEIFSHPVWIRFGKEGLSDSRDLVADLLKVANNLQESDPSTSCQVLLLCAVYQNYAGQYFHALKSSQRAVALAQQGGLLGETLWALWGLCAISVQQGNDEQAARSFVDIQAALSEQNEWILAGLVDVLRQSLFHPEIVSTGKQSGGSQDSSFAELLDVVSNWLQHWGFLEQSFESDSQLLLHPTAKPAKQPFFSLHRLQGQWKSLILAFRGELRLQWEEDESYHTKKRFSLWAAILSSLRLYISGREDDPQNIDARVANDTPSASSRNLLPPPKASIPAETASRAKRPAGRSKKVNNERRKGPAATIVPVSVHMLGTFSVTVGDLAVKIPASRGLSLFKYLLLHHKRKIPREVLMEIFWPDAEPETARNSLNVAMHKLRKALRSIVFLPIITFEEGAYGLEANLQTWLDVEEFERSVGEGQRLEARNQITAAVAEYETAISLYQGDFLEENPYEEWAVLDRERYRTAYLETLDRLSQIYFRQERYSACRSACQLILAGDPCCEDAHCLLMRCYSRQGQAYLALRQYHLCVEVIRKELEVDPAPATIELYEQIRRGQQV